MFAAYENALGFDAVGFINDFGFEMSMFALVACIVLAFFAMRLFKIIMSAFGGAGVGFIAYYLFGPGAMFGDLLPEVEGINMAAAVGLGAAVLGFILGVALPKLVLFIGGIGIGCVGVKFIIPMVAPAVELDPTIILIIGAVVGAILGILLSLLLRPVYILITSLGCSAIAGVILVVLVMPGVDMLMGAIGGAIFGLIPMIYQFRSSAYEI